MDFVPFAAFRPIVAGAAAALHAGLRRSAVEDRGWRHFLPTFGDTQRRAQVVGERFKHLNFDRSARVCWYTS